MFLTRFYYGIVYFYVLVKEITLATVDTAIRAVKGGKMIDPVVVDFKTDLVRPISQTILSCSIILTPGTVVIDLDSENKILKVAFISPRPIEEVNLYEPYIKKMLE
jgi:energy-converting hydrogenase B subunit A